MSLLTVLLGALALPATFCSVYLGLLTLISWPLPSPGRSSRRLCFDLIVPAHNEEEGISRTVASLLAVDWPRDKFRVVVVADNCSDATAAVARRAGAQVLERRDVTMRGKGYALAYAFAASAAEGFADAVVVVDADAEVSANLLDAFAARIERGARAIQANYGILNPWSSWRTQLITIAKGAFHIVRSRARERLGLSCGVRGNGWCVTHELLRQVPYRYYSLAEDLEYGIALGAAGCSVHYAGEAHADADMAANEKTARTQRQRWEQGRYRLVRDATLPLLRTALKQRSLLCLDLAFDLIVPPLSYVTIFVALFGFVAGVAVFLDPSAKFWVWWALGCALALLLHVLRGWQLSGIGSRGLIALAHVPGFILWRIWLLTGRKPGEWVRTEREKSH
jgi:1,2-diacylglycerol 3-beta-glucosyltransferase